MIHESEIEQRCEPFTVRGKRGIYMVEVVFTSKYGWRYRCEGVTDWYPDYGQGPSALIDCRSCGQASAVVRGEVEMIIRTADL